MSTNKLSNLRSEIKKNSQMSDDGYYGGKNTKPDALKDTRGLNVKPASSNFGLKLAGGAIGTGMIGAGAHAAISNHDSIFSGVGQHFHNAFAGLHEETTVMSSSEAMPMLGSNEQPNKPAKQGKKLNIGLFTKL